MELCDVLIGHDEHLEKSLGIIFFVFEGVRELALKKKKEQHQF